jgi:hypothetical protein
MYDMQSGDVERWKQMAACEAHTAGHRSCCIIALSIFINKKIVLTSSKLFIWPFFEFIMAKNWIRNMEAWNSLVSDATSLRR